MGGAELYELEDLDVARARFEALRPNEELCAGVR